MAGFLNGLAGRLRREGGTFLLVARIDDMAMLSRCLGAPAVSEMTRALAARWRADLGDDDAVSTDGAGHFCAVLPVTGPAAALRRAHALLTICRPGKALGKGIVSPAFAAVLMRGAPDVPAEALFEAGRRHLRGETMPTAPQLRLIEWPAAESASRSAARPEAASRPSAGLAVTLPAAEPVDLSRVTAYFQPQLCCDTGAVAGFEALARLRHPVRGVLGPADFLPMLSGSEQRALTFRMLTQGLAALRHWDRAGFSVGTVSINVTSEDLRDPHFADEVLWELDRQDVAPSRLVVEIVESLSPSDSPDRVHANLRRLTAAGCQVDLDDFGTGFAGFDSIRRLGVRRVKIDRSFVTGCDRDGGQQRMILAILALAEHLDLETLAEGVETADEHAFVAQIGCGHVQGYVIARPMPLSDTDAFLRRHAEQVQDIPAIRRRA